MPGFPTPTLTVTVTVDSKVQRWWCVPGRSDQFCFCNVWRFELQENMYMQSLASILPLSVHLVLTPVAAAPFHVTFPHTWPSSYFRYMSLALTSPCKEPVPAPQSMYIGLQPAYGRMSSSPYPYLSLPSLLHSWAVQDPRYTCSKCLISHQVRFHQHVSSLLAILVGAGCCLSCR